jgi:hypothetical protein
MSINQLIINFHSFLIACWPNLSKILEQLDWDESPYFLENWIQANWELIVEKQALESGELLVPYGYDSSSGCRYTFKGEKLTHRVTCKKKGQSESQYNFLCFVSKGDGVFKIEPPFDFIDVEDVNTGDRLSLTFDEVDYSIETIR